MSRLNPTSPWSAVESVIRANIETARDALETSYLPLDQTENLRGQIVALRELLRAANPPPPIDGAPLAYDVVRRPAEES